MLMQVCLFEDSLVTDLSPLNYFRHTSELICGARTLFDKVRFNLPAKVVLSLHCRSYIRKYLEYEFPRTRINSLVNDDYLFLNSRILYSKKFLLDLLRKANSAVYTIDEQIAAIVVDRGSLPRLASLFEGDSDDNFLTLEKLSNLGLKRIDVDDSSGIAVLRFPWDLILHHPDEIDNDFHIFNLRKNSSKGRYSVINKRNTYISPKAEIHPHVLFDASEGRISISDRVKVEAFSYIKGPAFVGEGTTVRSGANLYGPVYVGAGSKVSGEISNSILHPHVNKQHLGFVGHSYLCEWVNLGAGTTTSNLKNNYSPIYVRFGEETLDTGSTFLGSIVGDHTKTGINSMLNTGSIVGVSCNLFGSGYMPKLIRSFSWLNADSKETFLYDRHKAVQTAKVSMRRRNIRMSSQYEELFNYLYEKTQGNLI
jgi:UDP-N-acetylglucosamine diphosphorylase/glucosamine-1-phosphate N-acetyltransferase